MLLFWNWVIIFSYNCRNYTRARWCWNQVHSAWGIKHSIYTVNFHFLFPKTCVSFIHFKISEKLQMDSVSLKCFGFNYLESEFQLSKVGAVLVGFTSSFSYRDILLSSHLLNKQDCIFIQDAPDSTFNTTSDCGQKILAPCKYFNSTGCVSKLVNSAWP